MFNAQIYPHDAEAETLVDFKYPVDAYIGDEAYLPLIEKAVPEAIEAINPSFIIYNAGTDIYKDDPLGAMSITHDGLVRRDEIVFRNAVERHIPILMLLSGGYIEDSSGIIADSIVKLMRGVLNQIHP